MNQPKQYQMLAEWERHERTLIEWPVKDSLIWPQNYREVCEGYAAVARTILKYEPVTIIVNKDTRREAETLCGSVADFVTVSHNDAWARDNGPTFVKNSKNERLGINWVFNAWGEKYTPFDLDNEAARKLLEYYDVPCVDAPIVLEGGSIHVDGEGTLLTTEQCLLNPNRNPTLTRPEIENYLKSYLGVSKIIWLKRGLFGDETDGHVDNIACFAKPGTVLLQSCSDSNDPNYEITQENLQILNQLPDAQGRKFKVLEIPQPPARYYHDIRLTLSYLNFYLVNGGVILPTFGGDAAETDQTAKKILQSVFPDRTVESVDGMPLIKEGGNIHCITQQMPADTERREL